MLASHHHSNILMAFCVLFGCGLPDYPLGIATQKKTEAI